MPPLKHKFLSRLAHLVITYPKIIAFVSVFLAITSLLISFKFLELDTDQDNLISKKLAYHQRYKTFLKEFGDWEYLFVVFEVPRGKSKEAKQALLSLVEKIEERKDLFTKITYQENLSAFKKRGLLLLPAEEFDSLVLNLKKWHREINRISGLKDYASLLSYTSEKLKSSPKDLKKNQRDMEQGFNLLKQILDGLDNPREIQKLTAADLLHPIIGKRYYQDPDGFYFSRNGRLLFLKLMPIKDFARTNMVEGPLTFLREQMEQIRAEHPDVPFGVTGRPALQADEMKSATTDSKWAALGALLAVTLLFILYFKTLKRPLLSMAALICGISWSLGWVTLTLGHLNLLTIVFAIILIGLGIDYGIHFLFRYQQNRLKGFSVEEAVDNTLTTTGSAIVTGAVSSAAAFFSALFTNFLGLQELGFVAGTGILLCLLSQIITLPSFLILWDRRIKNKKVLTPPQFKGLDWSLTKPKIVLCVLTLFTLFSIPSVFGVKFDNNLLKLQNPQLESVQYEQKIIEASELSTWFAAFLTHSREQLERIEKQVARLGTVGAFESIHSILPLNQPQRIKTLGELTKILNLKTPPTKQEVDPKRLIKSLEELKASFEYLQNLAFEGGEIGAVEEIESAIQKVKYIKEKLREQPEKTLQQVQESQDRFFVFLKKTVQDLKENLSPSPLDEKEIPLSIKKRYVSDTGRYVLYTYPEKDIWQPEHMVNFITDLRQIDPQVTGSPIGVHESALRMKEGFYLVGLLTIIFVMVILWIDFRSLKTGLLAALPLVSGLLWLLAWMKFFGISLNLANFFALPILIGIGIDNGVHLMHRFSETKSTKKMIHTISPAISLSSFTTLLGFGALSFVSHRGLASFGQIMAVGSVTCLIASLLLIPVILQIFYGKKTY